jgi:hypothetical protein
MYECTYILNSFKTSRQCVLLCINNRTIHIQDPMPYLLLIGITCVIWVQVFLCCNLFSRNSEEKICQNWEIMESTPAPRGGCTAGRRGGWSSGLGIRRRSDPRPRPWSNTKILRMNPWNGSGSQYYDLVLQHQREILSQVAKNDVMFGRKCYVW